MTWTAIGMPSLLVPNRMDRAGSPVRLKGTVGFEAACPYVATLGHDQLFVAAGEVEVRRTARGE